MNDFPSGKGADGTFSALESFLLGEGFPSRRQFVFFFRETDIVVVEDCFPGSPSKSARELLLPKISRYQCPRPPDRGIGLVQGTHGPYPAIHIDFSYYRSI